ncbi:MAG: Phosphoenolpyruvate-protein phosphotransferase [Chlamydiae bacterium]|nr:Phosphoenolpyruvate-protein phosphotransferase [Chlamydiota bacterium]
MAILDHKHEIRLKGSPICGGIAIGSPFLFNFFENEIPEFSISDSEVESEVLRYRKALEKSKKEVEYLQKQLDLDGALDGVMILETHIQIMKDELITTVLEEAIREKKKNAEYIFGLFIRDYEKKLAKLTGEMFREKIRDVQDIAARILKNLKKTVKLSLAEVKENAIVFATDLAPSDAAEAKRTHIGAFVTEMGGKTSHAAIVARSRGIPYVSNINLAQVELKKEDVVIIDGRSGEVIVNPTSATLLSYRDLQNQLRAYLDNLSQAGEFLTETPDSYKVRLSANIEAIDELQLVHKYRGDGIGLFRSEYICLDKKGFPTEEEQFEIYKQFVQAANGLPIVIRTFDVGGDKSGDFLNVAEANPFLGCRAIRYMLQNPTVFRVQLRAILRASVFGQVKVMFPMVSGAFELLEAKKLLQEEMSKLDQESIRYDKNIKIGCMIEIPSAAITCDEFAKHCDFLSIGTNDLVQYSLAVDRSNQMMSYLYNPADPSVIRLIKMVVIEANRNGIPVSVCGEIAADPRFTALLLGLGVHELSCTARFIPIVKNTIRRTSIISACQLAETILKMSSYKEIQQKLNEEYEKLIPQDVQHIGPLIGH